MVEVIERERSVSVGGVSKETECNKRSPLEKRAKAREGDNKEKEKEEEEEAEREKRRGNWTLRLLSRWVTWKGDVDGDNGGWRRWTGGRRRARQLGRRSHQRWNDAC